MREIKKNENIVETLPIDEKAARTEELHFYYSRERRLAKAPPEVRALYEQQPRHRFGLFRSLTDSKPKALLFTTIVVMCLMILFMTYLMPESRQKTLGNAALEISALRYGGATFIVIKKTIIPKNKAPVYAGIVDISVYPENEDVERTAKRQIVFTGEDTEEFRFSVPFESAALKVFAQAGADSASWKVKTQ
ncbi:MAG: hypothetical protein LBG72_03855 [Spirochaetaceae bacterium]|jgi:hypothetical protein|nr:hypothetical protein [Spirochaetaceae bacterium]